MNLGMGDVLGLAWRLGQLYHRKDPSFFPAPHRSFAGERDENWPLMSAKAERRTTEKEQRPSESEEDRRLREQERKHRRDAGLASQDDGGLRGVDKRSFHKEDHRATAAWRLLNSYDQERRLVAKAGLVGLAENPGRLTSSRDDQHRDVIVVVVVVQISWCKLLGMWVAKWTSG